MRNPDRIDPMLSKLGTYWKANPDLRLGQIISNANHIATGRSDCFYTEDTTMMSALRTLADDE